MCIGGGKVEKLALAMGGIVRVHQHKIHKVKWLRLFHCYHTTYLESLDDT